MRDVGVMDKVCFLSVFFEFYRRMLMCIVVQSHTSFWCAVKKNFDFKYKDDLIFLPRYKLLLKL